MSEKNQVIPFGKYRGQEISQIVQRDPAYVQWLVQQAWFSEKFSPIYQLVVNNFHQPSDETPEHNALQVRFLDHNFRGAFFAVSNIEFDFSKLVERFKKEFSDQPHKKKLNVYAPKFEDISDVWFAVQALVCKPDAGKHDSSNVEECFSVAVEIKPSMGDDYPAVLRQVKRQKLATAANDSADWWLKEHPPSWFLLVDHFASNVVTLDQVRQMFMNDAIGIVLMSDVRECLLRQSQAREDS